MKSSCEIFPLLLTVCTVVKSKGKISQNFEAFSEYMNFKDSHGKLRTFDEEQPELEPNPCFYAI